MGGWGELCGWRWKSRRTRAPRGPVHTPALSPPPVQIVCGNRAGALTILLDEARQWGGVEELPGEERPTFIARSLHEVKQVLEQQLQLVPPEVPPQPLD